MSPPYYSALKLFYQSILLQYLDCLIIFYNTILINSIYLWLLKLHDWYDFKKLRNMACNCHSSFWICSSRGDDEAGRGVTGTCSRFKGTSSNFTSITFVLFLSGTIKDLIKEGLTGISIGKCKYPWTYYSFEARSVSNEASYPVILGWYDSFVTWRTLINPIITNRGPFSKILGPPECDF